ncbi:response regulator [Kineococcus sp. SYSU DK006]|uniref:response regulator n=1 Tax=Kineococcus sp. SYSU DK006 TaxID=3383127 RepID=UPI003D7C609B
MSEPTENADPAQPSRGLALVVDDAPTVRMYHGGLLRAAGFTVEEAGNGFEALEMLLVQRYDLVVTDVNMPQMDGLTLVRRLRGEALARSVPVITISTESQESDADAGYAAGANLYLVKPVAPELLTRVADLLTSPLPSSPTPTPSSAPSPTPGSRS